MDSTIGKAFSRTFGRKSSVAAPKSTTTTATSPPASPQPVAATIPPHKQVFIDTHPDTLATNGGHGNGYFSGADQNSLLSPDSIPSPNLQATVSPPNSAVPFSPEKSTAPPVHFATNGNGGVSGAMSPRMTHTSHMRESTAMSTTSTDEEMMPTAGDKDGLNPADMLLNRLTSYRALVRNLQQHFNEIALVEEGTSKAMQRATTLIYVPFRDGHQFVDKGGLQDICIGVRDSAKIRSEHHAAAARFVDETVVKNLRRLKQDIKSRIKSLKADSSLYNMKVFKERAASQERIGQLAKAIGLLENVRGGHHPDVHSDPYLIHLALKRQLAKQVHEENLFARGLQQCQEQIRIFESHIIREIKQVLAAFAQCQAGHASPAFSQSWAQTEMALHSLQEDTEWRHFQAMNKSRLFPSDLVDADPEALDYPCKENPYVIPIKTAYLSRQSSVFKNWKDGFFVLTLAGWLHVFSSSKDLGTGSVPERSIYLPTAVLGPHSDPSQKQHVFSLDGKGMGGLLHRDAQIFTVRAHSREEMLDWWGEMAKYTQAALVTQSLTGANLSHSNSTISRAGSVKQPGAKSPELVNAATFNQGPSAPYEHPNDKAEVPNAPVVGYAAPLPTGPVGAATTAGPVGTATTAGPVGNATTAGPVGTATTAGTTAAPVIATTTSTTTTTNEALPSPSAEASGNHTTFLPEMAPIQQEQHPLNRQNTDGSLISSVNAVNFAPERRLIKDHVQVPFPSTCASDRTESLSTLSSSSSGEDQAPAPKRSLSFGTSVHRCTCFMLNGSRFDSRSSHQCLHPMFHTSSSPYTVLMVCEILPLSKTLRTFPCSLWELLASAMIHLTKAAVDGKSVRVHGAVECINPEYGPSLSQGDPALGLPPSNILKPAHVLDYFYFWDFEMKLRRITACCVYSTTKKAKPGGLRRAQLGDDTTAAAAESPRFNPLAAATGTNGKSTTAETSGTSTTPVAQDQEMTEASEGAEGSSSVGGETASLALNADEAGDELSELRQTYEAAQKQFAESGTQEYLRGTIHECDRMIRNCGEEVYPSAEFNYIYASALHDFSLIGAEEQELSGFVEMALEYVSHVADLITASEKAEADWVWKYYLVAGKVNLQKADSLYEDQEAASSKKEFKQLGTQIHTTLVQATGLLDTAFKMVPEGEERHVVRLDAKSIEKVGAKEHEMVSAAANVALHADRFEEYERRKKWNTWALESYRQVTQDTPENVEAWQGIATCLHSIVGWWADQEADEENDNDDEDEDEEEPKDELSLPVYSTEHGQMSLQALEAIKKALELARKSESLTSDLLTLGAECHLNLVNIAVGDRAAAEQSKAAVALIKEAMATFPDPALEERYAEVLEEFEEIAGSN
ncbi:hypothetical protein BGZ47_007829 [Haplosporangium gracile]|nr:hypothetical protein BGZ47_007829 [Haplosporangium gracile]